ncbi:MAG TPA: hypothetical protein VF193_01665 [Steroidobacter sp.]
MTIPGRLEPQTLRRALAGLVSAGLHLCFFLVIWLSGGRFDGAGESDTPLSQLVMIVAREADRRDGLDLTPLEPTIASQQDSEQWLEHVEPPPAEPLDDSENEDIESEPAPDLFVHAIESLPTIDELTNDAIHPPRTVPMSSAEREMLSERLTRLAERLESERQTNLAWEQDGTRYDAVLIEERANDGTSLDRVVAEVSATGRGKRLTTRVVMQRLAFSQFSQMVDRWDPMVQLHDDKIVGRFHTNSRFKLLNDTGARPTFLGKVTTAARSFDMHFRSPGRQSEIFLGGVETRAGHILIPEELEPSQWAPLEKSGRIHELREDTRIRFFADGSYNCRSRKARAPEQVYTRSEEPVYFIAAPGVTLYVKGVVAGQVLVYSPGRIVIEGSLTYARDPREVPDSPDYLGLVSDGQIEIAPARVTGPGDLEIDGAILARRRFLVRDLDHWRSATMRIFGSLSAGTLSASEPRYATVVEYDERFENRRPPGFPSTDRFEIDEWDGKWVEEPHYAADQAP